MKSAISFVVLGVLVLWASALPSQSTTTEHADIQKSPVPSAASLPIAPLKWTGVVFPNGTEVTLYGDIQQVRAQLLSINSSYDTDFPPDSNSTDSTVEDSHVKRHTAAFADCHSNVNPTSFSFIANGAYQLNSAGGTCNVGPGQCTNIYCFGGSAIRLCNSASEPIQPSCSYLASYATRILAHCSFWQNGKYLVAGSLWDTDQYLVDVLAASC